MGNTKIILDNVSLTYPVYGSNGRSFKRSLINITTGGRLNKEANHVVVEALRHVSFTLQSGDRVGLLGHNGAGKTTLLRVLAQIYEPTHGKMITQGRISSLFDIELGMDPESTGYENIITRGLLLGLSKQKMRELTPEIEQFTEMGDFLAMPIKTYSAGMKVRLAFGIVTAAAPDILLMDEIIGAGDSRFMEKAQDRLEAFIHRSEILVMASHSNKAIRKFCNKLLWLEHGEVKAFGATEDIMPLYEAK